MVCWLPSFFLVLGSERSGSILFFCNGGDEENLSGGYGNR